MEEYKQDLYETYEESGNSVAYNTCLANTVLAMPMRRQLVA